MSFRVWLKPPRSLLVILFLLTLVSISAVAWFGYRLLAQDSVVEEQRTQEHLEQTADRIVVTLRDRVAAATEYLGDDPSPFGPVFLVTANALTALPPTRLFYRPFPSLAPEAPAALFADAEALEFQQGQPEAAVDAYGRLTASRDPAIRAGAWLRLARVLRKLGRTPDALEADRQLSLIPNVRVAGAPAELVGRLALAGDTTALREDLLQGRWPLTRGQFEFYWSQLDPEHPPPIMSADLMRAAALAWDHRTREPAPHGQATVWIDNQPSILIWRATPAGRAMLVTTPDALLRQTSPTDTAIALVDSEGRTLAGRKEGAGRAAVRTAAESQLPWTLYVTRPAGFHSPSALARQRYLLFGIAVMIVFLLAGTYFIARVIRRETAVSRLQSDFVSAVSHEFRSPLTSMRQLSEMLALGRAPSEARRQRYYDMLVNETERLQRLVEKLLNFGGMEAGKRQYHFEPLDTAPLVEHVAHEFDRQIAASGRLIELHGARSGCRIEADREALSIALRNLVDNALKYSPDQPAVWVEWERENENVAIRVRDKGPGIPAAERKQIFHKFVRGSAAASGAVKGMGVGLAMVHHIVTAHGGEIRVASEPGQGSTFTVLLPAAPGAKEPAPS